MGNSQDGQGVVDAFNRDNMVGAFVQFWTGARQGRGKFSTTRQQAGLIVGRPVVWVAGHAGCVALTHVEPVPHQPDGIEELIATVRTITETWRDDSGAYPDGAADPLEQIATVLLGPRSTRKR